MADSFLTPNERQDCNELFIQFSKGKDNMDMLDTYELILAIGWRQDGVTVSDIRKWFAAEDDGDYRITRREFMTVYAERDPAMRAGARLRRQFKRMDVDESGTLTLEEIKEGLEAAGFDYTQNCAHILAAFSGKPEGIRIEEFIKSFQDVNFVRATDKTYSDTNLTEGEKRDIRKLFREFSKRRTYMDITETYELIKAIGWQQGGVTVSDIMKWFVAEDDGNYKITEEEFATVYDKRDPAMRAGARLRRKFKELDIDNSDTLTYEEMRIGLKSEGFDFTQDCISDVFAAFSGKPGGIPIEEFVRAFQDIKCV